MILPPSPWLSIEINMVSPISLVSPMSLKQCKLRFGPIIAHTISIWWKIENNVTGNQNNMPILQYFTIAPCGPFSITPIIQMCNPYPCRYHGQLFENNPRFERHIYNLGCWPMESLGKLIYRTIQ